MANIHQLIANVLKIPEAKLAPDSHMRDMAQWDSLKHMELIAAIEQQYGIELTGDDIADMTSIPAIKSTLARYKIS